MTDWAVLVMLVAVALFAFGLGVLRRRIVWASLAAAVFLAFVWILAVASHTMDWHDADGWIDCWPRCKPVQDATRVILLSVPVIAGVLLVVALVTAIADWRGSRERGRG